MKIAKSILLTVDVEDWFQVENFKPWISFASWPSFQLRVEKNTYALLDFLDAHSNANGNRPIRATFFVLGWAAKKLPHLVKDIVLRGHEVASHGLDHDLCDHLATKQLIKDLVDSRKLLEDLTGGRITGFRAPSFSVNDDILKIIQDCGYLYDSSYNSFGLHHRYGHVRHLPEARKGIAVQMADDFFELPVSNLTLNGRILPWGGGGYFRLIPAALFKTGIKRILKTQDAYLFYIHSWEIDPDQPRVSQASPSFKFRHYINLKSATAKLASVIRTFRHVRFMTCRDYLAH